MYQGVILNVLQIRPQFHAEAKHTVSLTIFTFDVPSREVRFDYTGTFIFIKLSY